MFRWLRMFLMVLWFPRFPMVFNVSIGSKVSLGPTVSSVSVVSNASPISNVSDVLRLLLFLMFR